jgi:hypothetical protein
MIVRYLTAIGAADDLPAADRRLEFQSQPALRALACRFAFDRDHSPLSFRIKSNS